MIKPPKAWRVWRAKRRNAVYLVDAKGRMLDPRIVLTDSRFEIVKYKEPFLLISSPATRAPGGFEYTWDELLEGHPGKDRIMGILGLYDDEE